MASDKISKKDLEKLEKITYQIVELKKKLKIGTSSLSPLNYAEEITKFFNSNKYNPQFVYRKLDLPNIPKEIDEIKLKVDKIQIPEDLKEHYLNFLDDQIKIYKTKISIGTENFSDNAHELFDWGSDRLDTLLANTPDVTFKIYEEHIMRDAQQIKKQFDEVLKSYDLTEYKVRINTLSSHIISAGYKSLEIGNGIVRYDSNVKRLITHEIESHILQTQNVKNQNTPIAELSKYGNQILFSEGLAVYNEIISRKITPSAFEMYYFRIKAVKLIHKSFREIYNTLLADLKPTRAYVMTYRVKRGLSDTSMPGGFPKDASYLLGFHEIETLVKRGFPRKYLYLTKSPILSTLLLKYGIINDKKILTPKFYR